MPGFTLPLWLFALPLPFFVWWLSRRHPAAPSTLPSFSHPGAKRIAGLAARERRHEWTWPAGMSLLILALAGPYWTDDTATSPSPSHNIMLAVDVSGSMRAQDYVVDSRPVSRLDHVKQLLPAFIDQRSGDRLGLIAFADDAMTFIPMTRDHALFKTLLGELSQGLAGERTAIGDALTLASRQLSTVSTSRIVILFTDGSNTSGSVSPANAALLARAQGIRIYTVGIGSDDKVAFPRGPVLTPLTAELPLDTDTLQTIATQTGGQFYLASPESKAGGAGLARTLEEINRLEKDETQTHALTRYSNLFWLPLLFGLALLLVHEWQRRYRIVPC